MANSKTIQRLFFIFLIFWTNAGFAVTKPKTPPKKTPAPLRIIIDPGHGGKDSGALSVKPKLQEKDLILSISKQVATSLKKRLGAKVMMTRNDDRFISLGARDRIANQNSCDLFLSIHANAARNPKLNGVEIYYLNKATDQVSQRLVRRENIGAPKKEEDMEAILSDLLQTAATEESSIVARNIKGTFQKRLSKKYDMGSIRVKTALFYVLVGAQCPSLLLETGFITNPAEAKRLKKPAFQKEFASAVTDAVAAYFANLGKPESDL